MWNLALEITLIVSTVGTICGLVGGCLFSSIRSRNYHLAMAALSALTSIIATLSPLQGYVTESNVGGLCLGFFAIIQVCDAYDFVQKPKEL